MPLISLLGLVRPRVARPVFVCRRAGRLDDRRIYQRTSFEMQSFDREYRVDGSRDSLSQTVSFQQLSEHEQGRGIGAVSRFRLILIN
jgi:hypothetical protein